MKVAETTLHMGQTIKQQLKKYKRSVSWLAHEIGYDRSSLNVLLKEQKDIHPTLLRRIAKAMNIDFFILYSDDFQAQQKNVVKFPTKCSDIPPAKLTIIKELCCNFALLSFY